MISFKKIASWHNTLSKLHDDIREYSLYLYDLDIKSLESLPGYDVRLHQHIDALNSLVEGTFLLINQIQYDLKNKKYTGDN